jgi:hypothetical protein
VKVGIVAGLVWALVVTAQTTPARDPVRDLFEGVCSGCHTLERVKVQHRTKEEWRVSTRAMIDQGAVLTPEETNMLLDYLVKNFGPEDGQ